MESLALAAGFADARVELHALEPFAREVGVPAEHIPLFADPGSRFLIARKN